MQSYYDVVTDSGNRPIAGAQVFVYNYDGTLATLYGDQALLSTTVLASNGTPYIVNQDLLSPQANPIVTGADGKFLFFAANGVYSVVITADNYDTRTLVATLNDPTPPAPSVSPYVTFALSSASPNATVNVVSMAPVAPTANSDLALVPKGNGALLAQVPTGTSAGGNKRGTYAVDLVRFRLNAANVASGDYSFLGGGYDNKASNFYSAVVGGAGNFATGNNSFIGGGIDNQANNITSVVAGGRLNVASADYAMVGGGRENVASGSYSAAGGGLSNAASGQYTTIPGGRLNTASASYGTTGGGLSNTNSGQYATISGGSGNTGSSNYSVIGGGQSNSATGSTAVVSGGSSNTASGTFSNVSGGINNTASGSRSAVLSGDTNLVNGQYAVILGGIYGTARQMIGYAAQSGANPFTGTTVGMVQTGSMLLGMVTTNNSSKTMSSDGLSAGFTRNVLTLQDNSAIFFKGAVIANVTGAGDTKSWTFEGQIKRGSGASTTVLTGSTVTVGYEDTGASAWTLSLAANTTDGSLRVSGVGAVSDTVRWVCKLETTEVGF